MNTSFWKVAIGEDVREFDEETCLQDTWAFLREKLCFQPKPIAIVLEDQYGHRMGEIWESSMYFAMAETKQKLARYLNLSSFGEAQEDLAGTLHQHHERVASAIIIPIKSKRIL